jgi:UDP-2-acetamido-3-amino-2,3-dideoxy-glucuronate N-acetyltransferase
MYKQQIKMDEQGRVIYNSTIGENVAIKPFVHIKSSIIRNGCLIESFSYLYGCKLGENVKIMGNNHIPAGVLIDRGSTICPGVIFTNACYPGNYFVDKKEKRVLLEYVTLIEKNVTIGAGSIIGSGIKIGEGAFIGMGSVVTKDLPPFCLAYGNPAKVVKTK